MLIAHYIGDHAKDGLLTRLGWALTRLTQKGPFDHVTHCEAIHHEYADGSVLIASSSLRDGGVRAKQLYLNKEHWMIVDVPAWPVEASEQLLDRTKGQRYDLHGALATQLPGSPQAGRWFCNQWVACPYLPAAATFGPHHLAAITLSLGRDVTQDFFAKRQ